MTHVPYRGSAPMIADLLGNQINVVSDYPTQIPHLKAGKYRHRRDQRGALGRAARSSDGGGKRLPGLRGDLVEPLLAPPARRPT